MLGLCLYYNLLENIYRELVQDSVWKGWGGPILMFFLWIRTLAKSVNRECFQFLTHTTHPIPPPQREMFSVYLDAFVCCVCYGWLKSCFQFLALGFQKGGKAERENDHHLLWALSDSFIFPSGWLSDNNRLGSPSKEDVSQQKRISCSHPQKFTLLVLFLNSWPSFSCKIITP